MGIEARSFGIRLWGDNLSKLDHGLPERDDGEGLEGDVVLVDVPVWMKTLPVPRCS